MRLPIFTWRIPWPPLPLSLLHSPHSGLCGDPGVPFTPSHVIAIRLVGGRSRFRFSAHPVPTTGVSSRSSEASRLLFQIRPQGTDDFVSLHGIWKGLVLQLFCRHCTHEAIDYLESIKRECPDVAKAGLAYSFVKELLLWMQPNDHTTYSWTSTGACSSSGPGSPTLLRCQLNLPCT